VETGVSKPPLGWTNSGALLTIESMNSRVAIWLCCALFACWFLTGCSTIAPEIPYDTTVEEPEPTAIRVGLELGGTVRFFKKWLELEQVDLSGMARLDNGDYLLVHDSKDTVADRFRPRLGVLSVDPILRLSLYREIRIDEQDWEKFGGPAHDLEAVCSLPLNADEFLLMESSHHRSRTGRIFHIRLQAIEKGWGARILGTVPLPEPGPRDDVGPYRFEGMGCIQSSKHEVEIVLGDHGNGKKRSRLVWNTLDLDRHKFIRRNGFKLLKYDIRAPVWKELGETTVRHISDLYIDRLGRIWVASSYEAEGDYGPFASVVYMAGYATPGHILPVDWNPDPVYQVKIGGIKIEALGPPISEECLLSAGTDDEGFGGQFGEVFCKQPEKQETAQNPVPTN